MNYRIIKQAFIKSLPVMAGYFVIGIGYGILLQSAGYGLFWVLATSVFIYAGSMQYVGVGLIAEGASVITAIITTLMVNARHLFYSVSMIDRYKNTGKYKPYLIFALTDETYSLLCDGNTPEETDAGLYYFLVSLFNQFYWVAGGVVGNLLGTVLPFSTKGIEFSMTALFIASFTEQWLTSRGHTSAIVGIVSAVLCLIVFGTEHFLIPTMLIITLALMIMRKRKEDE